jgi:hypothetical protein
MEYEVALVPRITAWTGLFGCMDGLASDPAWRESRPGMAFPEERMF